MLKRIEYIFISALVFFSSCGNEQPQIPANKQPKNYTAENLLEINRVLAEQEEKGIEAYLQKSDIEFTKSPMAFWYHISKQGEGRQIAKGDQVYITYNLKMIDGSVCYTPDDGGDDTIIIGRYDIIKGLDEALLLLNEGGEGTFIIPSDLAFAMIGDQACVGAKKTVIYEIKSIEILP
jgi:FKBP-type peptidyl-prolyl cis-trans isomerase